MKNKQLLLRLIGGGVIVLIIIFLALFLSPHSKNSGQSTPITPTPIPLRILSTDPASSQTSVPVNQIITIAFNRNISPGEVQFTINPSAIYSTNLANNQLIITISPYLSPNTPYTYSISSQTAPLGSYTFTTAGAESAQTNDNAAQTMQVWSRTNQPDMFLYTQTITPYQTADFFISSDISQTLPYHPFFVVSLLGNNTEQSKEEFLAWLHSLGLTDTQIQTLDIRYQ